MKSLSLIPILLLAIIPSLAFATTHQETFPTFYRNMTIFKGDSINITNTDSQSYQVDGDGFGSGSLSQGAHALFTFNRLGDFAVFDDLHRNLSGFIDVIDPTLTPVIYTNETSYKQGDIVDIYGTNLIPVTSQTVTIFDSNGQVDQVLNTPIIQDRSMFLPITIPSTASLGEWKIVLIQNGQVITNSFIVTQGLHQAQNNDTVLSTPTPGISQDNSTSTNSTQDNSTINNSIVTVQSLQAPVSDQSQQIKDLTAKVDALTTKLDAMSTEQDSIFGMINKLLSHFNLS